MWQNYLEWSQQRVKIENKILNPRVISLVLRELFLQHIQQENLSAPSADMIRGRPSSYLASQAPTVN